MEHLYSVFAKSIDAQDHLETIFDGDCQSSIVSSLSNNNILAFSSNINLSDDFEEDLLEFNIYVVDLNLPYFPYKITDRLENVTLLEWDAQGSKLLIGDQSGQIEVWSMKDFLISDWQRTHFFCFSGDCILSGTWFHNGFKPMIDYNKKDLEVSYNEKFFTNKSMTASVVQFGGRHADGYLCITSSGFVHAHAFCSGDESLTATEFLYNSRMKIEKVDVAYKENGQFLVLATNGNVGKPIYCYIIKLTLSLQKNQSLSISCQPSTSFNLNCCPINSLSSTHLYITGLKFIVKENPDAAVVVAAGPKGSIIELWELREKNVIFSNLIQNIAQIKLETPITQYSWAMNTCIQSEAYVCSFATTRTLLFNTNPPLSYIIVAYNDKTLKCFYRDKLQVLSSIDMTKVLLEKSTPGNYRKNTCSVVSVIQDINLTWSSCGMVAIDALSQLHFFRLFPLIEPCTPMSLNFAELMLEYAIFTGNDYWDILINVKPQFVENICDKITDCFLSPRQGSSEQQKWFDSVLQVKAALYRCVSSGPSTLNCCRSGDFYAMKMLSAISETLKRLIRTRDCQDSEGPAEKLSYLMQTKPTAGDIQQFLNIDKILVTLHTRDFCLEPGIKQSFQRLLQWVCDLSLFLLASIPHQCQQPQFRIPGSGILHDVKSLNTIRELLVNLRFWGLVDSNYTPQFQKMHENIDVIFLIYKLLTKIVISPEKLDESIIDECCVLPNQVTIPQMDVCLKSIGIASPALYINSHPLMLVYNNEPVSLKYNIKVPNIEGAVNYYGNQKIDVIRYVVLGNIHDNCSFIRSCTRCNSVSLLKSQIRSPATRAWDQQWVKKCFCGGFWRIHAPSRQQHPHNNFHHSHHQSETNNIFNEGIIKIY